jgi:hypothetical protein
VPRAVADSPRAFPAFNDVVNMSSSDEDDEVGAEQRPQCNDVISILSSDEDDDEVVVERAEADEEDEAASRPRRKRKAAVLDKDLHPETLRPGDQVRGALGFM